jgi:UDP-N-acetylglucosamine 2-epimerase
MPTFLTIIGARPQFIKASAVSRELRKIGDELIVHTGQHYDDNMSRIFFDELEIPRPDYNLGIGSGGHGAQTGAMLAAIEDVLQKERSDRVLVYGDTNSTLAGALAAAKLHIPVAHVEAGLRSFNRHMPEEINRVITDHLSDILFCPSHTAVNNLAAEGITRGVHLVGDVMYEALMHAVTIANRQSNILERMNLYDSEYILATIHRAENTDQPDKLKNIIEALYEISHTNRVVFPVHPRTRNKLQELPDALELVDTGALNMIEPVGYLDMVRLESGAKIIMTDSGGIQKEAYWLNVPCVTLREETEWVETVEQGWNLLVGAERDRILAGVMCRTKPDGFIDAYTGKGSVSRLVQVV